MTGTQGWGISEKGAARARSSRNVPPQPLAPWQPPTTPMPRALSHLPAEDAQPHAAEGSPARVPVWCWGPPRPCTLLQPPPRPQPCSVCCALPLGTGQELFISHIVSCCCCRATHSPIPVPLGCPYLHPLGISPAAVPGTARCTLLSMCPWHCPWPFITPCPLSTILLSPPAILIHSALIPGAMPIPATLSPYHCLTPLSPWLLQSPLVPLAPLLAKGCSALPTEPNYPCLLCSEPQLGKPCYFPQRGALASQPVWT